MPPAPLVVALSLSGASLAGTVHLAFEDVPFGSDSAALTASGMVLLALVAISGVLLARGRWSRPSAAAVAAGWIALGATGGLAIAGGIAILLGTVSLAGALGPWLDRWVRHRPALDGPPPAAVTTLLLLLAVPVGVGVTTYSSVWWPGWVLAGWSVALAFALARAVPGSLTLVRVVHAPACLLIGTMTALLGGLVFVGGLGIAAAAFAWRREVAVAVAPVQGRVGAPVRIPPELAPPGVLGAAGLDEDGRA